MKTQIFKSRQILLLYLLKSKTNESFSKKKNLNVLSESCCIEILVNFKKSLRILFKYHSIFLNINKQPRQKINPNRSPQVNPKLKSFHTV